VIEHLEPGVALARDTGIMFWRASIDTHLAVARSRLGQRDTAAALATTLAQTRRNSERYLMVRCLDGLAEIALAEGDAGACLEHAGELLATAAPTGMREFEARALRWRGEALLARQQYAAAQAELGTAAALARDIGRVRLQFDTQAALARLSEAQGRGEPARRHRAAADRIAASIGQSLAGSGLEARLRVAGAPA